MAERRMFAKSIIDSDAFLEMPSSTQNLYFHLGMRADDDGFVNNPKKIGKIVSATEDDFKILFAKNFLIGFESGVIVIKHWKIHNYIQKDRYKSTSYIEEMALLSTKTNNSYTLDTKCIQDGYAGKDSIELGKESKVKLIENKITPEHKETNQIIDLYKKYFNKTYRLSHTERIELCSITNKEQYTIEDWEIIFKNASNGWDINGVIVKPTLRKILENHSSFLNNDYNLKTEDNSLDEIFAEIKEQEKKEKEERLKYERTNDEE